MELPEKPTSTSDSGTTIKAGIGIGANLPVWHSLNGNVLEANGWKKTGNDYHKDGYVMKYNGVQWKIGQIRFQWIEELNEYLTNGKLPE